MPRNPRYDILFEPIRIGPKIARNRMFQASHCIGAGSDKPGFQAFHRAVKADGGWAVVGTESTSISPDTDAHPRVNVRIWDRGDVRNLRLLTDMARERGALSRVQLRYGGGFSPAMEVRNTGTRRAPSFSSWHFTLPTASREMSKADIRDIHDQYVRAALLAREAGFDIIELLTSTAADLTHHFLLPGLNKRTDEYGGSLENRARFNLELLEKLRTAVGDDLAIACRYGVDTLDAPHGLGDLGIRVHGDGGHYMQLADHLVDMWDLTVGWIEWGEQAAPSSTHRENWGEEIFREARKYTTKPVGNIGRLTSPDRMVEMLRSGQCDIISAARPTIADPYIPRKIDEDRLDDIRECIGCNNCLARFEVGGAPIVCTQNATAGEEYRRGWHPEQFTRAANADRNVLVVGAGPAGMECARVLGERGMANVHLVEAGPVIGGHARVAATLPRLGEWGRVTDYRQVQLAKLPNVEVITNTRLDAEQILDYGAEIVVIATGATWSTDGLHGLGPVPGADARTMPHVLTPDQLLTGKDPGQSVLVYDLDGYYMGAGLAERLVAEGRTVTHVSKAQQTSAFTHWTLEQPRLVRHLHALGVEVLTGRALTAVEPGLVTLTDVTNGVVTQRRQDSVVLVTSRIPDDAIFRDLESRGPQALAEAGIEGLYRVGCCSVPGMISEAIFEGHRLAREIDTADPSYPLPFIRERRLIDSTEGDYTLTAESLRFFTPEELLAGVPPRV